MFDRCPGPGPGRPVGPLRWGGAPCPRAGRGWWGQRGTRPELRERP